MRCSNVKHVAKGFSNGKRLVLDSVSVNPLPHGIPSPFYMKMNASGKISPACRRTGLTCHIRKLDPCCSRTALWVRFSVHCQRRKALQTACSRFLQLCSAVMLLSSGTLQVVNVGVSRRVTFSSDGTRKVRVSVRGGLSLTRAMTVTCLGFCPV